MREGLSVLASCGEHLFTANDETAAIERLTLENGVYRHHRSYPLHDLVELPTPAEAGEEVDIEGIAYDSATESLWVTGSHSLRRPKPKGDDDEGIDRLADVKAEGNRYTIARIPLVNGEPRKEVGKRRAAILKGNAKGNELTKLLRNDKHLGPFLSIPSKDNGFDVEGIAVNGDRVFLGLRGPVLRGWSVILDVRFKESKDDPSVLRLRKHEDGTKIRKHFIDLKGLGVRDLEFAGDDLLILAGPTMDLDGPVYVFRWKDVMSTRDDQLVTAEELSGCWPLEYGEGNDHAEGMTCHSLDPLHILVAHDSPGPGRLVGKAGFHADVVVL